MTATDALETARLLLRPMPLKALKELARGNIAKAALTIAVDPEPALTELRRLAARRLAQLRADPAYLPWSLRAIVLRGGRTMVGYSNYHGAPGAHGLAPDAVELGYEILPAHRRHGYGFEAVAALVLWAAARGATTTVLSIAPDNHPSLRIAARLGAVKTGEHIDEEDGLEHVFAVNSRR